MAPDKSILVLFPLLSFSFVLVSFSLAADPLCSDFPVDDQIYLVPHEWNCSLYYECRNGDKATIECPSGLYFNPTNQACDFPVLSGCTNGNQCTGVELDYLPHPEDCTKYIECFAGDSYLMTCPEGYHFDSRTKMCVLPENSDCGTTTPPWTTPHPLCYGVRPNQTELKQYDGDCRKYWQCVGAELTLESCSQGLLFDEGRQLCDFPDLVDCDQSTRTPDPETSTPPLSTSTDFVTTPVYDDPRCTDGTDISYWPHPVLCNVYIQCYNGHSYQRTCPSGLFYSDTLKICVDPSKSDCGRTTPTEAPTPSFPTGWTSDPDCPYPEAEGNLLPFPGDCEKFYECAEGQKVEMACSPGLWFSVNYNECVYPYQAECTWGRYSLLDVIYGYFSKKW